MDIPFSTSTHTVPQWDGELSSRKLHADFVHAYGGRVFLALSAVVTLVATAVAFVVTGKLLDRWRGTSS